jgi:hypothetical protein
VLEERGERKMISTKATVQKTKEALKKITGEKVHQKGNTLWFFDDQREKWVVVYLFVDSQDKAIIWTDWYSLAEEEFSEAKKDGFWTLTTQGVPEESIMFLEWYTKVMDTQK